MHICRPRPHRLISRIAIVTVGLSVAGASCGSSSSGLAAADFTAKADAICQQVRDQQKAVPQPTDLPDAAIKLQQILDITNSGVDEFNALKVTGALKKTRDDIVVAAGDGSAHLAAAVAAAKKGDEASMNKEIELANTTTVKLRSIAKAAGMQKCGADDPTDTTTAGSASGTTSGGASATTGGGTAAPATTVAAKTTAPVTTKAAVSTAPFTIPRAASTAPATAVTAAPAGVPFIDPATVLTPWDGQKLVPFSAADSQSLVAAIASSPGTADLLVAVGALQAVDTATGKATVILFMELKAPLSAADTQSFYDTILSGTTQQEQGTVAGATGFAFVGSDGQHGFATVRNTTVILATSVDEPTLAATVGGLFQANPQL